MEILRVTGGKRLQGELAVGGAKNAVLPILAAILLCGQPVTLLGCPRISDVANMLAILGTLGCSTHFEGGAVRVDGRHANSWEMPDDLSKALRSSFFLLGPILGRFGKATVTYPGGCEIGLRPIDLHLKGLRALGVTVREEHGLIYCVAANLRGAIVHMDYPSVGATENVMMAAVLAKGKTTIHNAAREPEIIDLANFINACGGRITGAGSTVIEIEGVSSLAGATYRPMADRIVAGTYLAAVAATGGEITLKEARAQDMAAVLALLREMGCLVEEEQDAIFLRAPELLRPFQRAQTQPHPGFPTDMQAQMLALATLAQGTSVMVENVFESRFSHAAELARMGANIVVNDRTAVVRGGGQLMGAHVVAKDLRAGAALVIAGLRAQGVTEVAGVNLIDRGYECLEGALQSLGAQIIRV